MENLMPSDVNLKSKNRPKLIRITTVPQSLGGLLRGQLGYMAKNGFEVIGISSPGPRLEEVKHEERVRTIEVPMTRKISPLKDLKSLWQLYFLFKKEKPDIVHTHTPKAGTLGMIAAFLARVPLRLHTVAGLPLLEIEGGKRGLLNNVEKITYHCATHIYPNSYGLRDIILENQFSPENKLRIMGNGSSNGIDSSEFDPDSISQKERLERRKTLNIGPSEMVFLFVGRLVSDKGINELVQAFAKVAAEHISAHLVIVGNYEAHLDPLNEETIKTLQNHPRIHAVGYKKNVIPYFALADVLTFPSYREGFPNVVMQAAAMQLNAIVSDINGCNEIITNGKNGWVVPPKNIDHLIDRMVWCLRHPALSKHMGQKSRQLMKEKYERRFIWEQLLKEYQDLLQKIKIQPLNN